MLRCMRLWSISPSYLDPVGLVAVWREGLLAQKVLQGLTKGYRNHPQLIRFRQSPNPTLYVGTYLYHIYLEALNRRYTFDHRKINAYDLGLEKLPIREGQLTYEFNHLLKKLKRRNLEDYRRLRGVSVILPHPIFKTIPGDVEDWEKT